MQSNQQELKTKSPQYELYANLKGSLLYIELSTLANQPKIYTAEISNQLMSEDLAAVFGDVFILYECFKSPFQVILPKNSNEKEAIIKMKVVYQFKTRPIEKQGLIKLTQANISIEDQLRRKIASLQKELKAVSENKIQQFYVQAENLLKSKTQELSKQEQKILQVQEKLIKTQDQLGKIKDHFDHVYKTAMQSVNQVKQTLKNTESLMLKTRIILAKIKQKGQRALNQKQRIEISEQGDQNHVINYLDDMDEGMQEIPLEPYHQIISSQVRSNPKSNPPAIRRTDPKEDTVTVIEKPGLDNFLVRGNRIIHLHDSEIGDQIVINHKMRIFKNNKFRVRIHRSNLSNIYIGIIPIQQSKKKKCNDVICYFGMDGEIWDEKPLPDKVGTGFKEGDIVDVRIKTKQIVWKINRNQVISYRSDKLKEHNQTFLPVIEMLAEGDSVDWIPF